MPNLEQLAHVSELNNMTQKPAVCLRNCFYNTQAPPSEQEFIFNYLRAPPFNSLVQLWKLELHPGREEVAIILNLKNEPLNSYQFSLEDIGLKKP